MSTKKYITNSISGIWNSYGCPPEGGDGISISLEETKQDNVRSLIKLCNFEKNAKDIGKISDYKEISELVVMLPMIQESEVLEVEELDSSTEDFQVNLNDLCKDCVENPCLHYDTIMNKKKITDEKFFYDITENAKLFKIKESIINKILNIRNYKTLSIFEIKNKLEERQLFLNMENNIVKLMFNMVNYYFPTHLNWLLNKDIPPIMMYTAEFKSILSKEDLSDIWQGNMPNISTMPEEEEISIEHFLHSEEIFGNINIAEIDDLKMSIFKCKKIASYNYSDISEGLKAENNNWYNYNWPYDNFSLIEFLRIDGGEVKDNINKSGEKDGVLLKNV